MKAIQELKEEHQAVKLTLQILTEIAKKLSQGYEVNLTHLEQILDFLKTFVDRCHHGKEEDLLFPALEKAGIPREGGPIGVMLHEHNLGREYVRNLTQGITDLKAGRIEAKARIVDNIRDYSLLLNQHIDKEDRILYPMGEKVFSREQDEAFLKGFAAIEDGRIGAGKHEEFHRMLHYLTEVYLK